MGNPRHMMTMNTIYVLELTDPVVEVCALRPKLIAPPTIGPAAFAVCQIAIQDIS
jgi:hypothetical protein